MFERLINNLDPLVTIVSGFLVVAFIAHLVFSILAIWAVNTLFLTKIPITLQTIFAGMILIFILTETKLTINR